jgi:hypothetical protein
VRGRRKIGEKGGAEMKRIEKVVKGIGKVILALLTGIFMPLLVWVGLGVAINQKVTKKAIQPKTVPAAGDTLVETPVNTKKH